MAYAEPSDVAARLGRELTEAEQGQAFALLDDIEAIIRLRVTNLDERAGDDLFLPVLIAVEVKAVRRVFLNPSGIRQHSEGVDDFQQSDTFDTAISGSDLYVSDAEWALLGAGASARSGSFSMARGYR